VERDPRRAPRFGTSYSAPVGGTAARDTSRASERSHPAGSAEVAGDDPRGARRSARKAAKGNEAATGDAGRRKRSAGEKPREARGQKAQRSSKSDGVSEQTGQPDRQTRKQPPRKGGSGQADLPPARKGSAASDKGADSLGAELRAEAERNRDDVRKPPAAQARPKPAPEPGPSRRRWRRKGGKR
jgi:hypothetical protein